MNTTFEQETKRTAVRPASAWKQEPTLKEAILIWALVAVIFIATISILRPYMPLVRGYGDVGSYMQIAHAIRTWDFSGLQVKHLGPALDRRLLWCGAVIAAPLAAFSAIGIQNVGAR